MPPIKSSHSDPFERGVDYERPVVRRNPHRTVELLEEITEENPRKRSSADDMRRSPERGNYRAHQNRVFKPRRGRRRERRFSPNASFTSSQRSLSLRRIRGSPQRTQYSTIDSEDSRSSSVEGIWYRVPPPEHASPGLVIARFYDEETGVNETSVLDISRPFTDLLELLKRQSSMVKPYFTGTMGGFTMDDGPWWYEILIRPGEGEILSPEEQWVLLGDGYDYGLLIKKVMLYPRTWSVVFRHHTQMLYYGLSERTQALMRQRVSGKSQGDKDTVENMIAQADGRQADETSDGIASDIDPMDIS